MTDESWASVRPIRSRSQVMAGLGFLAGKGEVTREQLKDELLKERRAREYNRANVFALNKLPVSPLGAQKAYEVMVTQFVRLMKYSGLIEADGKIIRGTGACNEIAARFLISEEEAEAYFLGRVTNSRFTSYWRFLKQLKAVGGVRIPPELAKRDDPRLRQHLYHLGFPINVVSFFTLRDFYYDFGLLNYLIGEQGELILPTYTFDSNEGEGYELHFQAPEAVVYYSKKVPQENFEAALLRNYEVMSGGRDVIVGLIELREATCSELEVSERTFNKLFESSLSHPASVRIRPSIGDLLVEGRSGRLTKVLTLPMSKTKYPYTLVRVSRLGA